MYEIDNIYLVAALMAYGADYVGVDRADKRMQRFHFGKLEIEKIFVLEKDNVVIVDSPTYEFIKEAYENSMLFLPPTYIRMLKRVKGILYA
jgi:hypothetical protein